MPKATYPEPPAMPEPLAVPRVLVRLFSMAAGMELQVTVPAPPPPPEPLPCALPPFAEIEPLPVIAADASPIEIKMLPPLPPPAAPEAPPPLEVRAPFSVSPFSRNSKMPEPPAPAVPPADAPPEPRFSIYPAMFGEQYTVLVD